MRETVHATDYMKYSVEAGTISAALSRVWVAVRPVFEELVTHLFEHQQVLEQFAASIAAGKKARVLVVGCDEGLPTSFIAGMLKKYNVAHQVEIFTVDSDLSRLDIAYEYCKSLGLPPSQLHFYQHNMISPLAENTNLRMRQALDFDMVYSMSSSQLPDAKARVEDFYMSLRPSGAMFLGSWFLGEEGPYARKSPHPALALIGRAWFGSMQMINPGVEVSTAQADWLRALGAEVETEVVCNPVGGETARGIANIQLILVVMHHFRPEFVQAGLISQAKYDEIVQTVYRELTKKDLGVVSTIITYAGKPK